MSKKWILTICFVVLACLSGAFWLLTHQTGKQKAEVDLIAAVPFDAMFMVQFDKLVLIDDNFATPAAWNNFVSANPPLLIWIKKTIETIHHSDAAAFLLHSKACLSAHPLGKNELAMLCCIALPPSINEGNWENLLSAITPPESRTRYQESTVTAVQTDGGMLYFAYVKGVGLISSSLLTVQSAILHLKSDESLMQDEHFAAAAQTIGRHVDMGFLLNHRQLPHLLNISGNKIPSDVAKFLSYTANWTVLDGQITPNIINLNGFVFPSFTTDNYLSIFLHQTNTNTNAWEVLPSFTNFMLSISMGDAKRFLNDYNNFLDIRKELNSYKQKITALDKDWSQNATELFGALYPAEVCVANVSVPTGNHWITLLKTTNVKFALEQLQAQATQLHKNFVSAQESTKYGTFTLYNNPVPGLFETLLGSAFATDAETYFTTSGDWFYFSDDKTLLKQLAGKEEKTSLKKYLTQTDAAQYITNNACITLVVNTPDKAGDALLKYLHPRAQRTVVTATDHYPVNAQILQLRPSNDKLYVGFFSMFETKTENKFDIQPEPVQTLPDEAPTPIAATAEKQKPQKEINTATGERLRVQVVNHYSHEKEIFVQLSDNSIGLQNKEGQWLWKKKFDEPILDTVIQIDYLRNGKLQMLFTTRTRIHLYDRNGNPVTPYPITWQTPAATGMAVFDYEKDRNYRIFVADTKNTVRAYDKRIQPVEGWAPFKTQSSITCAPQFFRVASRDYVIVCDQQNTYILDRKGKERIKPETPVVVKPGSAITAQQQPALLKTITTEGKQTLIYLKDGKVEVK
jgi:hypothetical protein